MPEVYDDAVIRLQYPENWTLEQGDPSDEVRSQVTLSSPNTAFWSLSVYPGVHDAATLLGEVLQALQAEYPELEHEAAKEQIEGQLLVGYDIFFHYLDLTNTAFVRVFPLGNDTCLLLAQSEDRELATVEPVFEAITHSLLSR